jgi:hypothetical protein
MEAICSSETSVDFQQDLTLYVYTGSRAHHEMCAVGSILKAKRPEHETDSSQALE